MLTLKPMETRRLRLTLALFSALLMAPASTLAAQDAPLKGFDYLHEQPLRSTHGMVVSLHQLATEVGNQILHDGGNAIDAAVATGFTLAVVYPAAGNLGGGGFLLLRTHDGHSTFLDFRETAPLGATEKMYLDSKGEIIPNASILGYRSIATPGSVAGLAYAEKKYGHLGLARVMAPAIKLAREGFILTAEDARYLSDPELAHFPDSSRLFQRSGNLYKAGDRFAQPELARTLERIAANPDDFYHGKMADELVADLAKGGALITREDLARYRVVERAPITGRFHNLTIISSPPPSSGGIALVGALNILEPYDLSGLAAYSPNAVHLVTEAFRRAYMDRGDYLGDPDFNHIPIAQLTSTAYADAWRKSITAKATPSDTLTRPAGFLPPPPNSPGTFHESMNTTHFSVVDAEGNAVSVTTTLDNMFGSHVSSGTLGFLLNDEMDDFSSKPGTPNMFGLIQGPSNAIAPGKRPLSSMTPTIVLEDGKLRYVLGSPGGSRIITTVADVLLSSYFGKLNIEQAVDAPRYHHQFQPDVLSLEPGFPADSAKALTELGYKIELSKHYWSDGECISVDPKTGALEGAEDHRRHHGKSVSY